MQIYTTSNYLIRRCLMPQNNKHFSKFVKGLDKGGFCFPKFYNFFFKRVIEWLFGYYGLVPKEEKQKIRRSSS